METKLYPNIVRLAIITLPKSATNLPVLPQGNPRFQGPGVALVSHKPEVCISVSPSVVLNPCVIQDLRQFLDESLKALKAE